MKGHASDGNRNPLAEVIADDDARPGIMIVMQHENGTQEALQRELPLLIGRGALCQVQIRSWRVAREHARLLLRGDEIWVEDLGSLLGTCVNGERVASYGPLSHEDELLIGPCLIQLSPVTETATANLSQPGTDALAHAGRFSGAAADMPMQEQTMPIAALGKTRLDAAEIQQVNAAARTKTTHLALMSASSSLLPGEQAQQSSKDDLPVSELLPYALPGTGSTALVKNAENERHEVASLVQEPKPGLPSASTLAWQAQRRRLHADLIAALQLRRRDIGKMSDASLRAEARQVLKQLIADDTALPAGTDSDELVQQMLDEAVGLGPLEPLLQDASISEIMVNRHDEIYIERAGRLLRSAVSFSSEEALLQIIERIVAPLGRRIDDSSPMADARLPDGSRVHAIIPPIALRGASLTIRKFPARRLDMQDLLAVGSLDQAMASFLEFSVLQRKNIVVSGGTGSGKTSLLNVLSNAIPSSERIITIEDAAELRLHHAHLISLEARPANLEGKGQVNIRDLVRNALRMRPDRIVVGECRGAEAFDMLAAMNTGHEGSLTTLHANSPRDALGRLETMILMAGMDLPLGAIREHIASSVDLIVQLARTADGRRMINAIVEITGMEAGRIQLQDLFLAEAGPPAVFRGCGLMPESMRTLPGVKMDWFMQCTRIDGRADLPLPEDGPAETVS